MDNETEDIYLQKLEEFIFDEDKIVTFTWLCLTLGISAHDSRCILTKYVKSHRDSKPNELAVTYLLSGLLEDKSITINIVKEDELENKKKSFKSISDQKIYSVQKSKQIDFVSISLVDSIDVSQTKESAIQGAIISKFSVPRVFKTKTELPLLTPSKPAVKTKNSFFSSVPKSNEQIKKVEKVEEPKSTPVQTTKQKLKEPKNGIANFFNQSNTKTTIKPKVDDQCNKKTFTKPKVDDVEVKMKTDEEPVLKENVDLKQTTKSRLKNLVDSESDEEIIFKSSESAKSKEKPKSKANKKRPRKENKKNDSTPKRLKRVKSHDSDSDDIFASNDGDDNEQESIIENSEEEIDTIKPVKPLAPKNKKRKLVEKTYTDEEGYLTTCKEWIEESASEDELKPEPMQNEAKIEKAVHNGNTKKINKNVVEETNGKTANAKAKGGKGKKVPSANQPTLMNFFKKK